MAIENGCWGIRYNNFDMSTELLITLSIVFFLIATLYSSVGHAGASGYLAVMILLGVTPAIMKPTALLLNIVVSTLVCVHLWRNRLIDWHKLLPLIIGSIPAAAIGASFKISDKTYFTILAVVMIVSAILIFKRTLNTSTERSSTRTLSPIVAVLLGAAIGLLSGITGTGGGIFLSPLLILLGWATMRQTAALSAPFILFNSISGLSSIGLALPHNIFWLIIPVGIGGLLGARLSTHILPSNTLLRLLSFVMLVSAAKLIL